MAKDQSSSQDSSTAQGGSAGEDIMNMSVSDLLDVANQQNIDVSALNNLLSEINVGTGTQEEDAAEKPMN